MFLGDGRGNVSPPSAPRRPFQQTLVAILRSTPPGFGLSRSFCHFGDEEGPHIRFHQAGSFFRSGFKPASRRKREP